MIRRYVQLAVHAIPPPNGGDRTREGWQSYTELRQNLARYMDEAVSGRAPIVVTRQGGRGNVVIIPEEEFEGWRETVHLLSSPRNAERLLRSKHQLESGSGRGHALIPAREQAG